MKTYSLISLWQRQHHIVQSQKSWVCCDICEFGTVIRLYTLYHISEVLLSQATERVLSFTIPRSSKYKL